MILAVPVPEVIDHVPPGVASVKAGVVSPVQTVAAPPPIATGGVFDDVSEPRLVVPFVIPAIVPVPGDPIVLVMFPVDAIFIPLNCIPLMVTTSLLSALLLSALLYVTVIVVAVTTIDIPVMSPNTLYATLPTPGLNSKFVGAVRIIV